MTPSRSAHTTVNSRPNASQANRYRASLILGLVIFERQRKRVVKNGIHFGK